MRHIVLWLVVEGEVHVAAPLPDRLRLRADPRVALPVCDLGPADRRPAPQVRVPRDVWGAAVRPRPLLVLGGENHIPGMILAVDGEAPPDQLLQIGDRGVVRAAWAAG